MAQTIVSRTCPVAADFHTAHIVDATDEAVSAEGTLLDADIAAHVAFKHPDEE